VIQKIRGLVSSKLFRIILGILVAAVSLYLSVRNVSWSDVQSTFSNADVSLVVWALMSVVVTNVGKGIRWKVLLGTQGQVISHKHSLMMIVAGQALNTVYPARVGDLSRAYIIGGMGPGGIFVIGTIILEKIFDMFFYSLLFITLLLVVRLPGWVSSSAITVSVMTVASLLIVFILSYRLEWFSKVLEQLINKVPLRFRQKANTWRVSGLSSLTILKSRWDLVKIVFWSAIIWITAVLTNQLCLLALNIHLPITASILVLILLQVSMTLPSVPGRIGIFEYLCVLALGVFGVDDSTAFSYGILLHVVALLPQTIIGLAFLGIMSMSNKHPTRSSTVE
jgi:glycosyltransferase 2 family protein